MTAATVPVYDEAPYKRHKSSRKSLTPREFVGKLFVKYFNHGWSYIYAVMPKEEKKAKWYTKKGYPLELRNLWSRFKNKGKLLGLRFGKDTNYLLFDFDRWGEYHPYENEEKFKEVLGILEEIGLCRPIIIRSSQSGGLHVYYFLPYHVHSFTLAATIERVLADRGHFLRKGHLEVFPNPKPYNKSRITDFNGHRLPLQPCSGSYLVDFDYQPVSDDISIFLQQAEFTSSLQDMESLSKAMTVTDRWYKRQFIYGQKRGDKKMSGAEFRFDLEEVIDEGWTGRGQTNDLLLKMGAFGVVFLALSGERLVDYIVKTAINSPGYAQYCGHRHEIDKRAREVARSAENFAYLPYCNYPTRHISYSENFYGIVREGKNGNDNVSNKDSNIIRFPKSRERHEQTVERVAEIVGILKAEGAFPEGICKRERAIRAKSIEMYGVGGSFTTLRKPEYLPLWHPLHEHKAKGQGAGQEIVVGEELVDEKMLGQEEKVVQETVAVENEDRDCLEEKGEVIASEGEGIGESDNSEETVGGNIIGADIDFSEGVEEIREEIVEEKQEILEIEEIGEGVNSDYSVKKNSKLENRSSKTQEPEALHCKDCSELQVHLENERLKARQEKGCRELQVLNIYEGVFAPLLREIGEENGGTTYNAGSQDESERGEGNGEAEQAGTVLEAGDLENPSLDRVIQIFFFSLVWQIFQSLTVAAMNSNELESLIEALEAGFNNQELINSLQGLIDKGCLYFGGGEKSKFLHQKNLYLLGIILAGRVEGRRPQPTAEPRQLEANTGAWVSQEGGIISSTVQFNLTGSEEGCSSQQEAMCECGNSQDLVSRAAPTENQDAHSTSSDILPQQWLEVHFKLKAPKEARRLLNVFCNEQGEDIAASVSRKREILEQFLRYCLMWRSPFEALRLEARAWFKASRDLIAQIDGFTAFWDYFGELVF
jgi:hypothetical protein